MTDYKVEGYAAKGKRTIRETFTDKDKAIKRHKELVSKGMYLVWTSYSELDDNGITVAKTLLWD